MEKFGFAYKLLKITVANRVFGLWTREGLIRLVHFVPEAHSLSTLQIHKLWIKTR